MNNLEQAFAETTKAIVASVSDVMDGEWGDRVWEQIVVNYETLLHTPEATTSTLAFSVARSSMGVYECVDFRLSDNAEASLENIAEITYAQNGVYWTACNITIEREGEYRFTFSYEHPYRLSGHLDDKRFDDYLELYLMEHKAPIHLAAESGHKSR